MPNFYPRPPRGGRPLPWAAEAMSWAISIHALREEGDISSLRCHLRTAKFLSTPSARRATMRMEKTLKSNSKFLSTPSARRATSTRSRTTRRPTISIHALREEGDADRRLLPPLRRDFYPRPPRGGRRDLAGAFPQIMEFLSTPSARRATGMPRPLRTVCGISIHALREEGDSKNRDKISIFKQIIQHSARI